MTITRNTRDESIRDAAVMLIAVAFAYLRQLPVVYFPTVVHEGKGPVYFHYPILGMALALLVHRRRPFRTLLLFGIVHLASVLAFEWGSGLYSVVLGGSITPHVYLVAARLYTVAALATFALIIVLIVRDIRIPVPTVPDYAIIVALAGVSFLLRVWWGRHVLATGQYLIASDDGQAYHYFASLIVKGTLPTLEDAFGYGGRLYWFFLAGLYRLFGVGSFNAVIVCQSLLGAFIPVAIYVIAKRVTGSQPIAAAAGVLTALNRVMIFLSGVLGMEALYIPLLYVALTWLIVGPGGTWAFLGLGLLFELTNLARNEIFGYAFLLLFLTIVFARQDRAAVRGLALVCVGYLVGRVGEMGLTYLGTGQLFLPSGQAAIGWALKPYGVNENWILNSMGFNPFSDLTKSLHVWASHFTLVNHLLVVGFVKRLGMFLLMPGDGLYDLLTITDADYIHNAFPAVNVSYPALLDSYALLFCLVGLFSLRRFRREQAWALWTFVVYVTVLNALIIAKSPRHRASLIPIFVFAAVQGFATLLRSVRAEAAVADELSVAGMREGGR